MVWVDIGGGTARNLEFFAVKTLRRFFRQIYVVDVSRSMLEVRALKPLHGDEKKNSAASWPLMRV